MAAHYDDELQLTAAAQHGDLNAFNVLVARYQDVVYTLTYRILGDSESAQDASQETFITAYRRIGTYRGGVFRAWLLRIAANTSYDQLRYNKRRPATALDDLPGGDTDDGPPLADPGATPEQVAQQHELNAAIQDCINSLNDEQRRVLVMSDIEGYAYHEIADATGSNLGTVKSRLSRARLGVRRCLQGFQELLPVEYRLFTDD
jgi:RNA polymerase sigma-70 factor (ECF subfamily)